MPQEDFHISTSTSTPPGLTQNVARALVLDGFIYHQYTLRAMLDVLKIDSTLVSNGTDAVGALAQGEFEILFIDCDLPSRSGLALANALDRFDFRKAPFVIGTSSIMSDQILADCFASGMATFLLKPFRWEQLCESLKESGYLPATIPQRPSMSLASLKNVRLMAQSDDARFEQLASELLNGIQLASEQLVTACRESLPGKIHEVGHQLLSLIPVIESEKFGAVVRSIVTLSDKGEFGRLEELSSILNQEHLTLQAYLQAELVHYRASRNPS